MQIPMTSKTKALIGIFTVAVVFLLGYIPASSQSRRLQRDLMTTQNRIADLEHQAVLAEARRLASLMLLETLRRNYGVASEYSSEYFNKVAELGLTDLLDSRDAVTTALAQADPSSLSTVQTLLERTNEITRN
jgi:hypothetical protein